MKKNNNTTINDNEVKTLSAVGLKLYQSAENNQKLYSMFFRYSVLGSFNIS